MKIYDFENTPYAKFVMANLRKGYEAERHLVKAGEIKSNLFYWCKSGSYRYYGEAECCECKEKLTLYTELKTV